MRKHLHSTAQLPVRISVLLVVLLVYLAEKLSLDVLLGAFAAGVVVRLFIKGEDSAPITSKLEAIGFGFLIPIFFIDSGIKFDLHALIHMPKVLLLVPMFTVIFLLHPQPAHMGLLPGRRDEGRGPLAGRPVGHGPADHRGHHVAWASSEHRMKPQNAAALVAAGMLSVLIYPLVGLRWLRRGAEATEAPEAPNLPERLDGK